MHTEKKVYVWIRICERVIENLVGNEEPITLDAYISHPEASILSNAGNLVPMIFDLPTPGGVGWGDQRPWERGRILVNYPAKSPDT